MRSSFVHRFQERIQPFGKCDITTAAAEPSRFLEIGLGESANRTARAHPHADRPRFSRPDHPSFRREHRNYYRRRASVKAYVGNETVLPADITLGNSYSELRRGFEYSRAGESA